MQNAKRKTQNRNFKLKTFEFCLVVLPFYFCLLSFIGCATVPRAGSLPTYRLHGTTYVPVIALCESLNINYQYDMFTRTMNLSKGSHQVNFMVGQDMVLVDGAVENLKYPVEIYQGTVMVPYKFREQVLSRLAKEAAAVSVKAQPVLRLKKIVIDAGHGGTDPGAISRTGLREKHINLDIARRLAELLKSKGIEVIMTRSSDVAVSLQRRVNIANKSGADLFISIHANSSRVKSLSGFEAYYIWPYTNDNQSAQLAAEDAVLDLGSSSFMQPVSLDLKKTLWDMIYTANRAEAQRLCRSICQAVDRNLNTKAQRVRGSSFYVLKGTAIPAILLEVGFLSNREEERLLRNSDYRQQVAEAIAKGINNYAQETRIMEASRQ